MLNDLLPPSVKYEIADAIVTESRSKSDVARDVWDALVQRGLVSEPKREIGSDGKPYLSNYADAVDGHYCIAIVRDGTAW